MTEPKITLSASQLQSMARCSRLWYFQRVMRLPQRGFKAATFGTVLHAVLERYFKGEEMYPDSWWQAVDRDGTVTAVSPQERGQIKELVQMGIDEGVVERIPGAQEAEYEFRMPVMEDVDLIGFIDLLELTHVHDHKTAKTSRYLKGDKPGTANYLGDDIQLLTYAKVAIDRAREHGHDPAGIQVSHDQFVKDPTEKRPVRKVTATVSAEKIDEHWAWVQARAAEALQLKQVTDWKSIDGPNRHGACGEYGGCAFESICGGCETPDDYTSRMKREDDPNASPFAGVLGTRTYTNPNRQDDDMSFFSKTAKNLAPSSMPEAPQLNPEVATEAPEKVEHDRVAPWAVAECTACGGSGINSAGNVCAICDQWRAKQGKPGSEAYKARWSEDEGQLVWSDETLVEEVEVAEVVAEPTVAPPMPEETVEEEEEEEQEIPDEVEAPKPTTAKKKAPARGRPKKGLTLIVNASVLKGKVGGSTMLLEDVLRDAQDALAEHEGVESYFELNAFDRRDKLAQRIPQIVEALGTATVVSRTASTESRELLDRLRPYATTIIEGVTA